MIEAGNVVTQVYRRRRVHVTGYVVARVDGAAKPVRQQGYRRSRMYRNWDRNWNRYRYRVLHRNRIWLLHWYRDWVLHWDRYWVMHGDRYCLQGN